MQVPCCEKCLPTGMHSDEPKCPKKGSKNHCVDCYGYWSSGKGSRCAMCSSFWCTDYQHIFAHALQCGHQEIEDEAAVQLEEGVCPLCFFGNNLFHCSEPTCDLSYNNFLTKWLEFCTKPIPLGSYKLKGNKSKTIEIYIKRQPKDGKIEELWPPNTSVYFCGIEGKGGPSYKTAELAVDTAKRWIEIMKGKGFAPHKGEYSECPGHGILSESRIFPKATKTRDSSPKRKRK